jgi:ribosome-binding factor A
MSQHRLAKINSLIQQELSNFFCRELELPEETLLTITGVETTGDLKQTKIYVSVFPQNMTQRVLSILEKRAGFFQNFLNKKLKMYFVPQISFILDNTENRAETVEDLLNKIKS